MKFITITADGDYELNGDGNTGANGVETTREQGVVTVEGVNTSVTIGYKNMAGNFIAYSDGLMTNSDALVVHGYGTLLMVKVVGVAGTLTIGYAG